MRSNYNFANEFDASQEVGDAIETFYVENEEEIKEIIKYAIKQKYCITPHASGTSLTGSSVPKKSIVVNTLRMNKIISLDKNSAVVESGVILDDLNYVLSKHQLYFPIQPSSHSVCTIGGMVSCNASGKEAMFFGKTLQWINWIEFIDGNGKLIRTQNFPEFSEGSLGIITKICLKLTNPIQRFKVSFIVNSLDDALGLIDELITFKPISLEIVDKIANKIAYGMNCYLILAEFDEAKVNDDFKKKIKSYENENIKLSYDIHFFELRDGLYSVLASRGFSVIQDPQAMNKKTLTKIIKFLNNLPWFGHIGSGILHPCFKSHSESFEFLKEISNMKDVNVSGEHGYGVIKKDFRPKENLKEIKRLKVIHDPHNLFNPWLIV